MSDRNGATGDGKISWTRLTAPGAPAATLENLIFQGLSSCRAFCSFCCQTCHSSKVTSLFLHCSGVATSPTRRRATEMAEKLLPIICPFRSLLKRLGCQMVRAEPHHSKLFFGKGATRAVLVNHQVPLFILIHLQPEAVSLPSFLRSFWGLVQPSRAVRRRLTWNWPREGCERVVRAFHFGSTLLQEPLQRRPFCIHSDFLDMIFMSSHNDPLQNLQVISRNDVHSWQPIEARSPTAAQLSHFHEVWKEAYLLRLHLEVHIIHDNILVHLHQFPLRQVELPAAFFEPLPNLEHAVKKLARSTFCTLPVHIQ